MMSSLKTNAVLNAVKQSCSIIFHLITFPYISRVLGKFEYGRYTFSFTITSYFILFSALGISAYAIREGARIRNSKSDINLFCNQLFSINVFSAIFSYIALGILLLLSEKIGNYSSLIIIQSLTIVFSLIGQDWINSIFEDYLYITIRYITIQVLAVAAIFLFVLSPNDIWKYCIIATLASSGGNLVNIFYIRKYIKTKFTLRLNIKKHFSPILTFLINSVAITIYVNSDITILGSYVNDTDVGIYGFDTKIYSVIKQLINAVLIVVVPRLTSICNGDRITYNVYVRKIFSAINALIMPCTVGLFMMSREIILLVGGLQYERGNISLKILSIAIIFAMYSSFFSSCFLVINRKEKKCLLATVVSAIVNIGLNFCFIPTIGFLGAAIATLIAEMVNCYIQFISSVRLYNFRKLPYKEQLPVIIGGILIIVTCIMSSLVCNYVYRLLIAIIISVITYTSILLILKNATAIDIASIVKKIIRQ